MARSPARPFGGRSAGISGRPPERPIRRLRARAAGWSGVCSAELKARARLRPRQALAPLRIAAWAGGLP